VVGLVEHRDLDGVERHSPCSMRSCSRPGRRDDDVGAAAQLVDLATHAGAAVDGGELEVERLAERRERVGDLLGQLAGRHQHQAAGGLGGALAAGEPGEHRQAEGQRLARAGGAAAQHVTAGEASGTARVWMANGASMPRRASAVTRACGRPSEAKVASSTGEAAAASAAASSASSRSERTGGAEGRLDPEDPPRPRRGALPREGVLPRCDERVGVGRPGKRVLLCVGAASRTEAAARTARRWRGTTRTRRPWAGRRARGVTVGSG
jgi:hypothetical protein